MKETIFAYTYGMDLNCGRVTNLVLSYSPPSNNLFDWVVPFIKPYPPEHSVQRVIFAMTDGFDYDKLVPCRLFKDASDDNIANVVQSFVRELVDALEVAKTKWTSEALIITKSHLYKIGLSMDVTLQTNPYCCIGLYADECERSFLQLQQKMNAVWAVTDALLQPRIQRDERAKYLPRSYFLR